MKQEHKDRRRLRSFGIRPVKEMIFDYVKLPMGWVKAGFANGALVSLGFCKEPGKAYSGDAFKALSDTRRWLEIYAEGRDPGFLPRIDLSGVSPYTRDVCAAMLKIPYGQTATYCEIACAVAARRGARASARAAGGAAGRNPVAIIIPCHRVLGVGQSLHGYGGGLEHKAALLIHEGVIPQPEWERELDEYRGGDKKGEKGEH